MSDEFTPDEYGDPTRFAVPPEQRTSSDWVLPHIQDALGREVKCEPHGPYECRDWWYVPEFSIGTRGFIVDKRDRNILGLSSRPDISLARQFTAYAVGFRHDLMNLTITVVHRMDDAVEFLSHQHLWHNAKEAVGPGECPSNGVPLGTPYPTEDIVRWTRPEIEAELLDLPCCFRSQRLHEPPFLLGAADLPFDYTLERGT